MIGITPALFTRSGMCVLPPEYIRVPRTRLAYWTGIRRWPSWMKMIAAITRTEMMAMAPSARKFCWTWRVCSTVFGSRPTIPAKMMKLIPFPMPRSLISSPSHMRMIVPAVSDARIESVTVRSEGPNAFNTPWRCMNTATPIP